MALPVVRSLDPISFKEGIGMASLKQDHRWKESQLATLDDIPYNYLSEQTRELLTYLKRTEVSKFIQNLCPASRAILLSGHAELYQQMLAIHLSPCFEPKLLLLDVADFFMEMKKNYGYDCNKKPAGNQGEVSAAEKSEEKAESAGPEDESIPQSQKDGSSPPAKEVPQDNEFEKGIRPEIFTPEKVEVRFPDIGGMDEIKKLLKELMLPLEWPHLFKDGLPKPCKGILLFGPPGTGKTMLAKAIAAEVKASFINCSMSTITSAWSGEAEKNVRALFTLAAKVAPTIIFVDDVDSLLAKRKDGEQEFMRIIKNEFMSHWDGLMTKPGEQILVLGATNRPFDLDEAAIRRFERRVMVGLPSAEDREKIFTTLLSTKKTEGIDFRELARVTEGYAGSDLKTICNSAASQPFLEYINDLERKKRAQEKENSEGSQAKEDDTEKEMETITIRALTMEDMEAAKKKVGPSFPAEGPFMKELTNWNELYGEGGSRKKTQLSYFN